MIDSTRAREELGWSAEIPLEAGLAEVIDWVEDNLELIQKEPQEYVHKE